MRNDGRENNQLRPIKIIPNFIPRALGSVLFSMGNTRVLTTASIVNRVPQFLYNKGRGWLTAEYSLLPASTGKRTNREVSRGKVSGRTHEIQRLVGRVLRSVMDLSVIGERTIWIDCDVIEADGGTRTASINGAWIALRLAVNKLLKQGELDKDPIIGQVGAVSLGLKNNNVMLDIDYSEDSSVDVDMNIVMDSKSRFVEIQGTAEQEPFSRSQLDEMLNLASTAISQIHELQKNVS